VARGNGAPAVTFALLKGAMAGAKRRGASSAQRHVERGSGGGPQLATTAAGGRYRPESTERGQCGCSTQ
jgi:hypothetical protein